MQIESLNPLNTNFLYFFPLFYFEIILNSQESCKYSTENFFSLNYLRLICSVFSTNKDIFPHNHSTTIQTRELTLKHYYYETHRPSSSFTNSPNNVFYSNKIQLRITCYIQLYVFHFLLFETVLQYLIFMTLTLTSAIGQLFLQN